MGKRIAKKVLLIGWDAADWKIINPLMDAGHMPTLSKMVEEGVMGNLATLDPPLSPMLWTSISTGKRPYKHGIHGFTEPDPDGKGLRPIWITSRKVKAIWNILTQHRLKTNIVGWWPSHPAEPVNGVMVSNFYQRAGKPITEPWSMPKGTVHPESKADLYSRLRVHPGELTEAHVLPFVPNAESIDQTKDKRLVVLSKIIADCSSVHSAATYAMEHEEWDFMGVYYDAIDHFCHGFMKFHPPQLAGVPDELYETYKDVVISGYKFHDMMLERLLELAGEDTTVMLISDHGFHPDHLRPLHLPKEPAAPAMEHSPYGVVVIKGPGIKKDERIYGASLLDVTPTLLSLFGLPIARDMDGNVMINAFEETPQLETIDSWENIPGDCGMHPKDMQIDTYANQEAMEQLIELGYIDKPDENIEKAVRKTIEENEFYLARAYMDGGKSNEALPILERLFKEHPDQSRYGLRLLKVYQLKGRISDARSVYDTVVIERRKSYEARAREKLEKQGKELKNLKLPETTPGMRVIEGNLLLSENKASKALEQFKEAEKQAPELPNLNLQIGRGYLVLRQWEDAARAFEKELKFNRENASAYHGLGLTWLRRDKPEQAVTQFLNAVGLLYHFPFAHYHLGEALFKLEDYERAAQAFEVSLQMAPGMDKARKWLVRIYADHLDRKDRVEELGRVRDVNPGAEIAVVSGLPRSGTSMMMQMLEAGGMPLFTDRVREADNSNPKGYYEHEAVKGLMRNKAWMREANGKAVKVVSHLLMHMPQKFHYKVIFMEREMDEILSSQHKMLQRQNKATKDAMPLKLVSAFSQNLRSVKNWIPEQDNLEVLYLSYVDVLTNPEKTANQIADYLGREMNIEAMIKVVDPTLHREKTGNF